MSGFLITRQNWGWLKPRSGDLIKAFIRLWLKSIAQKSLDYDSVNREKRKVKKGEKAADLLLVEYKYERIIV